MEEIQKQPYDDIINYRWTLADVFRHAILVVPDAYDDEVTETWSYSRVHRMARW
jgi:hypothetical protein